MEVATSQIGKKTLKENINFLLKTWTSKEVDTFLEDVENVLYELKNDRYKISKIF